MALMGRCGAPAAEGDCGGESVMYLACCDCYVSCSFKLQLQARNRQASA
jgi:hypothetical protein